MGTECQSPPSWWVACRRAFGVDSVKPKTFYKPEHCPNIAVSKVRNGDGLKQGSWSYLTSGLLKSGHSTESLLFLKLQLSRSSSQRAPSAELPHRTPPALPAHGCSSWAPGAASLQDTEWVKGNLLTLKSHHFLPCHLSHNYRAENL